MNRELFYKEIKTETLNLGSRTFCRVKLCWNLKILGKNKQTTSILLNFLFFFLMTLFPFRTLQGNSIYYFSPQKEKV